MQLSLELLAPARNADIGIAAIDCGADAVYIAGPSFGARAAAGNPVDEIARLCRYAHRYGARIHSTVNTLLQVDEREQARKLMWELYEAGVDVFLVQDLSRLVLERQLTLDQVRAIRAAVPDTCLLEFFIHGALCVGYSGQCYLSQYLTGRSANRGACAQPCRSRYDLVDADGKVLVHDHTLLSPKDLRFDRLLPALVAAGIRSFKIEGRLKNAAYVKNVVRYYRDVIDRFIEENPAYCKASSGRLEGGFIPDPGKTFTRGWTEAFLQGRQERLASEDAAKALGEPIGEILSVKGRDVVLKTDKMLVNGDGLSFVGRSDDVTGARAEVVQGNRVTLRDTAGLLPGMRVYRNLDVRFEKELEKDMPVRIIDVAVSWNSQEGWTKVRARTEDGFSVEKVFPDDAPAAEKPEAARESIRRQLDKRTGPFAFHVEDLAVDVVRFYPAATLNGIRRELAAALQEKLETRPRHEVPHTPQPDAAALNRSTLDLPEELLRSRYCIKWELGLCTRFPAKPGMTEGVRPGKLREPLYLVNQKNKLRLAFDCARCEMAVLPAADR